jgi:hypothetical protein
MEMKKKILERCWDILGKAQLVNVFSILAIITSIASMVFSFFNKGQSEQSSSVLNIFTIFILIAIVILIIITSVNIWYQNKNSKRYQIIEIFSKLQNKYILSADITTAKEHGDHSKEKDLKDRGEARILTNSLSYDMFFCISIADNVTKGARYIYIIPKEDQVITELKTFIVELHDKLYERSPCSDPTQKSDKTRDILKSKVEFWSFKEDVLCLYNFARFRQDEVPPSTQYWWYVNPKDDKDDSHMLTQEIKDKNDQKELNEIFDVLKRDSFVKNAWDIYENRERLDEYMENQ